jgi:hypothetical protein
MFEEMDVTSLAAGLASTVGPVPFSGGNGVNGEKVSRQHIELNRHKCSTSTLDRGRHRRSKLPLKHRKVATTDAVITPPLLRWSFRSI